MSVSFSGVVTGATGPTGPTGPTGYAFSAIQANTATLYTFALTDASKLVTTSNAGTQTLMIPANSSIAFGTGDVLNVVRAGTGPVVFNQASGVTIRSTGSTATAPTFRAQYSGASAIYEGSNIWYVLGDIS
jgi:hypothetical protein